MDILIFVMSAQFKKFRKKRNRHADRRSLIKL